MRSLASRSVLAGVVLTLASPEAVAGDYPEKAPYIGIHLGPHLLAQGWDLGKGAESSGLRVDEATYFHGGLRLGYQVTPKFALEGGLSLIPVTVTEGGSGLVFQPDLDALLHFNDGGVAFYGLAGLGAYQLASNDLRADFDPQAHVGIGVRALFGFKFALRVELRAVVADGFNNGASGQFQVRIGGDLFLKGPPDADKDGIIDDEDSCPSVKGVESADGCPDADGDSLTDAKDSCPQDAGPSSTRGCPDQDGDRIPDKADTCPAEAGPVELDGCPDGDKDKIADKDDACPTVAGIAEFKGCPDTDGDGLTDASDTCPNEAGPRSTQGCPDRDHDGVADADDKCPDLTGLKDYQGCVPEAVKKFTGTIKGINFETNSAKILPSSFKTLDAAVKVVKDFQDLNLRIEGHTDDVGDDALNFTLSQDRAESVRAYFLSKGIDASRLIAEGFGETKPMADNTTNTGRAQNRRIDFKIVEVK